MIKAILTFFLFLSISFSQAQFEIGIKSGVATGQFEDVRVGSFHSLNLGFRLLDKFKLTISGGYLNVGSFRNDIIDHYVFPFDFCISYYLNSYYKGFYSFVGLEYFTGEEIYHIVDIDYGQAGKLYNTLEDDIDGFQIIMGLGYSTPLNEKINFNFETALPMINLENNGVAYIRLIIGASYIL